MTIIEELINLMKESFGKKNITVEDIRIGVFYTAAKLSTGDATRLRGTEPGSGLESLRTVQV